MYRFALLSLCFGTFPSLAAAQSSPTPPVVRRGMVSTLASGLSIQSLSLGPDPILMKGPGNQSAPPAAFDGTNFPGTANFKVEDMFGLQCAPLVKIDAHSTGADIIPALDPVSNEPNLEDPVRWLALAVSVTNGTQGAVGSLIRNRVNQNAAAGADLFSYYFQGSQGIDPNLPGATLLEQRQEDMGFSGNPEIDALDFGLGVRAHAQNVGPTLIFRGLNRSYYFSLEQASAQALNALTNNSFATDEGLNVAVDGASIYRVTFTPGANGQPGSWSTPEVYRSANDLDLLPGDEVDAIAVDPVSKMTIFSTTAEAGVPQLQIHDYPTRSVHPLRSQENEVSGKLGLGSNDETEDIDAVCVYDPEGGIYDALLGIAIDPEDPNLGDPMGLSVTRTGLAQQDDLVLQVTGFGGPGFGGPSPQASTVYFVEIPSWQVVTSAVRGANEETVEVRIPLPATYGVHYYHAFAIENVSGQIHRSFVVALDIP